MHYHNSNISISHRSIEQCQNISECVHSSLLFNPSATPSINVDRTSLPHSPLDTEGSIPPPIPPKQFSDDDTLQYPTLVENSKDSPPPPIPPQQFSADDTLLSPKLLESGVPQQCERDAPPPRPPKTNQEDAAPTPRPPKTNQEDAALPPHPPKTNQEDAPPPRPPKTNQEDATPPPRPPKTHQHTAVSVHSLFGVLVLFNMKNFSLQCYVPTPVCQTLVIQLLSCLWVMHNLFPTDNTPTQLFTCSFNHIFRHTLVKIHSVYYNV